MSRAFAATIASLACAAASACLVNIAEPSAPSGDGGARGGEGGEAASGEASAEASREASSDAGESSLDSPASETAPTDAPPETVADVVGEEAPADAPVLTHYLVFTTSVPYSGNLGGLAGADQKCQDRAKAGNLTGSFKAWLSDATTSAAARLTHGTLPYVMVDGTPVASDWTGLTTTPIQNMIVRDENGNLIASTNYMCGVSSPMYPGFLVWTNSLGDGTIYDPSSSCQSWTSPSSGDVSSGGSASPANQATSYWSDWCHVISCDTQAPLYCVQQ